MTSPLDPNSAPPPRLILASASPRRHALLQELGIQFEIMPANIDESPLKNETPLDYVKRVATQKCESVHETIAKDLDSAERPPLVLAADTVVILGSEILGKPATLEESKKMLQRLSGKRHCVSTAFKIIMGDRRAERTVETLVDFRQIQPSEIDAYQATNEWQGKAGGYAIQGIAGSFVQSLRGSLTNVIGLPMPEVLADLRALGALPSYPPKSFGVPQ